MVGELVVPDELSCFENPSGVAAADMSGLLGDDEDFDPELAVLMSVSIAKRSFASAEGKIKNSIGFCLNPALRNTTVCASGGVSMEPSAPEKRAGEEVAYTQQTAAVAALLMTRSAMETIAVIAALFIRSHYNRNTMRGQHQGV